MFKAPVVPHPSTTVLHNKYHVMLSSTTRLYYNDISPNCVMPDQDDFENLRDVLDKLVEYSVAQGQYPMLG